MGLQTKTFYIALGLMFLFLTIYIPSIPELFTIDLSNLSNSDLLILQYSFLAGYLGCMFGVALDE